MSKIKINKHTFSLFLLVISTFFISQSYNTAISFAQTEPDSANGVNQSSTESILVCEFVQFCSNPVESSRNDNETSVISPVTPQTEAQTTAETEAQTTAETEAQTTADSSDVVPDVTSNISLIMTPDLPGSVPEEASKNPINQDLLSANETFQTSLNATDDNQITVPENATVITPDAPIPVETTGENISMTNQDDNDTITTGNNSNNQSEFADTIPLNNLTMSIDDSNMSQDSPMEVTIDSLAANETIELDTPVQNEDQSATSNEFTSPSASNEGQQNNTSNANDIQSSSSPSTENQTAPTSFLDPIINPFKELFGLK